MFKKNDLVTIQAEWLEQGESPDLIYLVINDESDYGAVQIFPSWDTGLRFPPIHTVKAECLNLYKDQS
jgi:hypothetical protein